MTHLSLIIICVTVVIVFGIIDNTIIGAFRCVCNYHPKDEK
jgi:hypothetical protein